MELVEIVAIKIQYVPGIVWVAGPSYICEQNGENIHIRSTLIFTLGMYDVTCSII